jgi:hypothetical protein
VDLGYKITTVAREPSVERVVRAIHSTRGKIGTHMSLRVPPLDSVARPWGWSHHGHDSESYFGTHRVAPEATGELKAQLEAKFHMYCFGLR